MKEIPDVQIANLGLLILVLSIFVGFALSVPFNEKPELFDLNFQEKSILDYFSITPVEDSIQEPEPFTETEEDTDSEQTRSFAVYAKKWEYIPSVIEVEEGDIVRITFKSLDVKHGFFVKEYGINEIVLGFGEKTFEFTANKKGEFQILNTGGSEQLYKGMKAKLIVR